MSTKTHAERQRGLEKFCARLESRRLASHPEVPTFYCQQDEHTPPCCVLTRGQARQMKEAGLGKFENHGRTFRLEGSAPAREASRFSVSESADSCESISFAEMLANVGITNDEPGTAAPRGVVRRARQKIRAIHDREGFDKKSPLAFGSRPVYQVNAKG
jgi:hypothetical protein